MTGDTAGLGCEVGILPLKQRNSSLQCRLDRVRGLRFQRRLGGGRAFRARFYEQIDDWRVAMQSGDFQRRQAGISGQLVLVFGIDVGATFDEQFDDVEGKPIGARGVHERGPPRRIQRIYVGAMIQQKPDGVGIRENRRLLERASISIPVKSLGNQKVDAFRTLQDGMDVVNMSLAPHFFGRKVPWGWLQEPYDDHDRLARSRVIGSSRDRAGSVWDRATSTG